LEGYEDRLKQLERIAGSVVLRGSESLCRLLRYLGQQALESPGVPVREYQIATQVFGRPNEFDPRLDSTVRVQTGRLRAKLAEYYRGPGANDAIVVEIPKGTYQLGFRAQLIPEAAESELAQQPASVHAARESARRGLVWKLAFAGMTVVAATLAIMLTIRPAPRPMRAAVNPGESLEKFWSGLLGNPSHPIIAFRSGIGETLAMHALDNLFASLGHTVPAKPMILLSQPDMDSGDVIFLGQPPDNIGLRGFHFQTVAAGGHKGETAILNLYPLPGEPATWMPAGPPVTEDYAVISLEPGPIAGRWLLTLAGTSTWGTQAAAEFVCHEDTVRSLLEKAGRGRFEALVHTRVLDGVPSETELVLVHSAE